MHVDGGVSAQVLAVPQALHLGTGLDDIGPRLSITMTINNRLGGNSDLVQGTAPAVTMRSIGTLIKADARGSVVATAAFAERHGAKLCVTTIGTEFEAEPAKPYDRANMNRLFDYGATRGRQSSFC